MSQGVIVRVWTQELWNVRNLPSLMALAFFAATFWSARLPPNWKFVIIISLWSYFSGILYGFCLIMLWLLRVRQYRPVAPWGQSRRVFLVTYFDVLWNAGIELSCGWWDAMNVQSHSTSQFNLWFSWFDFPARFKSLLVNLFWLMISCLWFSFSCSIFCRMILAIMLSLSLFWCFKSDDQDLDISLYSVGSVGRILDLSISTCPWKLFYRRAKRCWFLRPKKGDVKRESV